MSILNHLGFGKCEPQPFTGDTDTVRAIVEALDRVEPGRARFLAAFAYILSRVAHADLKASAGEIRTMERILAESGGLPLDQAEIVVGMAIHYNKLFGATEDFLVTREFKSISTREEKIALLDCLYRVAAAEDRVSLAEDNAIRQVAHELGLTHREFVAVRSRYRGSLSFLNPGSPA